MLVAVVAERNGHTADPLTSETTLVLYQDDQLCVTQMVPPDTVLLTGDIDITNSSAVADVLAQIRDRFGQVVIDTAGLRFIDVSGWRVIIAPDGTSTRPRLVNVAPCVRRLTQRMMAL